MDLIPDTDIISSWLLSYGGFSIFVLMTIGIIAIPVPEETLMVIAGILMSHGKLNIPSTMLAAYAGSICGITLSYTLGRTAGIFLIHKYGKWIGIKEKHLTKAHKWFERFGKWTLFIGYFIPGVRHFTGFLAGTTYLNIKQFTLFAYVGAIIWVTTFLSIGYFFGDYWLILYKKLEFSIETISILGTLLLVGIISYILIKRIKQRKSE